jgi:NAD(P)-dependent dehydrogenase (short-subunit alcohol dehydrogenase family)
MHDVRIDLKGRTALVTGSARGIGAAIAAGPARAGARVAVNGRSTERVQDSVCALEREVPGADVVPVAADVTTEAGAEQVAQALPRMDILVNNLGVFGSADPLRITADEWRRYFEVNVLAAVRLTRLFLPGMAECG